MTGYATRTSPVVRGKWILENLLGTPPPPPPANVPPLSEEKSDAVLSMRERMVQHRRNPACAACHALMDPVGLSLENFDAIGRWRTLTDGFQPIDASGSFPDGTTFDGVAGLRAGIGEPRRPVRQDDDRRSCSPTRSAAHVAHYDQPAVRAIERAAARRRLPLLLHRPRHRRERTPFQMRRPASGRRAGRGNPGFPLKKRPNR